MPNGLNEELLDSLTVHSRLEELQAIRAFIARAAERFGFSDIDCNKIQLAVDEACSNIIRHAYAQDSKEDLKISIIKTTLGSDRRFTVLIDDNGKSYDILSHKVPDMKDYIEREHKKGGLGIKIIRMVMDEIHYQTDAGSNRLILTKILR